MHIEYDEQVRIVFDAVQGFKIFWFDNYLRGETSVSNIFVSDFSFHIANGFQLDFFDFGHETTTICSCCFGKLYLGVAVLVLFCWVYEVRMSLERGGKGTR